MTTFKRSGIPEYIVDRIEKLSKSKRRLDVQSLMRPGEEPSTLHRHIMQWNHAQSPPPIRVIFDPRTRKTYYKWDLKDK